MTIEEIRKNAPDEATHYLIFKDKARFYRWHEKDGLFRYVKKEWYWVDYFLDEILKPLN